jgi:hypothetical protein
MRVYLSRPPRQIDSVLTFRRSIIALGASRTGEKTAESVMTPANTFN